MSSECFWCGEDIESPEHDLNACVREYGRPEDEDAWPEGWGESR